MRGERVSAPRWLVLPTLGVVSVLLLACIIPASLTHKSPTPTRLALATPTLQVLPSPTVGAMPNPGGTATVSHISEQQLNEWLQGMRTSLGEGVDCRDMQVKIHKSGIVVSATVQAAQLQGAVVPMEVDVRPLVRDQHLGLEVLDVRLGGAYASLSGLIKPLVTSGIANSFTGDQYLAGQGVRVASVELQEGYLVVTSVPVNP